MLLVREFLLVMTGMPIDSCYGMRVLMVWVLLVACGAGFVIGCDL